MKNVLITGASHGVGKALAKEFARAGYQLYLNSAHDEEALLAICKETGGTPLLYDISDHKQVLEMFSQIDAVDILINNAGIAHIGLLQDMTYEEWKYLIDTNLGSVFSCCHEAIPHMLKNHAGRIINISSVWGECGASCEVAYSASKGGVNAFTKALAKELAPSNIQVNAISLGVIDTRMNRCFSEEDLSALSEEIPTGRMAAPEEAAAFIYQIATAGPYLTGQVIRFDGGWI